MATERTRKSRKVSFRSTLPLKKPRGISEKRTSLLLRHYSFRWEDALLSSPKVFLIAISSAPLFPLSLFSPSRPAAGFCWHLRAVVVGREEKKRNSAQCRHSPLPQKKKFLGISYRKKSFSPSFFVREMNLCEKNDFSLSL